MLAAGERALQAGKHDEAIMLFDRAVSYTMKDSYALYQLATSLGQKGLNGAAMNLFMRSIDEASKDSTWLLGAWCNLGVAFRQEGHEEEARTAYDNALELDDKNIQVLANYAGTYVNMGEPEKGIEFCKRALDVDPYNAQAGHHYGLCLLEAGDYENGWRWYQSRTRIPEFHERKYPCPLWFGEKVGKLVIHGEQGIGDEILFSSLIGRAKARAEEIVVECQERLIPILERSFGFRCYPDEKSLLENEKGLDAYCPLGTLPMVFGIKEPLEHSGYLKPDPERVEYWKQKFPGFRVGLSWRGGTRKTHEEFRNFQIPVWLPLILPGFKWISLQYNEPEHERKELGLEKAETRDFDDHLSLVASCDLVITVCNTTVHEAGSTNTPCWVLVPNKPAWRYGISGERMLWYPSAKLYRQGKDENWTGVIERLKADLSGIPGIAGKDA